MNYFTLTSPFYPLLSALKQTFQAVISAFSTGNTITNYWRAPLGCQ
jgi:hypothetical protein